MTAPLCGCGETHPGPFPPYCERCLAHHGEDYIHPGDCCACGLGPVSRKERHAVWCDDCIAAFSAELDRGFTAEERAAQEEQHAAQQAAEGERWERFQARQKAKNAEIIARVMAEQASRLTARTK